MAAEVVKLNGAKKLRIAVCSSLSDMSDLTIETTKLGLGSAPWLRFNRGGT
jgi:hypothetical protein